MAEGIVIGNLTIPVIKGDKGDKGNTGEIISISLVLLSPSSTAYAVNNGSTTQAQIELGIPKGLSVSTTNINASGELVFTFNDGTTSNVGQIVGKGISEVAITEEYDFVVTYTDGTSVTACNLEDEILGAINDILESYYTKTEIDEMGFITKEVNNLTNYTLKTNTGSSIELSINNSTYVMTLNLKNSAGTTISTGTIDLPLETMVVGAIYDNTNKKIVLTLKNGSTIDVPVADLISGLQAEITNANKLSADLVDDTNHTNKFVTASEKNTWNAKYNKPSGGIPKTDLSSSVQTSLGKADTAVQDVSGKEDKTNKTSIIDENSTNTQYTGAKAVYDALVLRDEKISNLKTKNELLVKDHVPIENTGTELQLTGTGDLPMELVPYGNAPSQETREGYNLIPNNAITRTKNGIQFIVNNDKSISINGTATEDLSFYIFGTNSSTEVIQTLNGNYTVSIKNSLPHNAMLNLMNGSTLVKQLRDATISELIRSENTNLTSGFLFIMAGTTINTTIYPMLVEGTYTAETLPEYEQYGASPTIDFPSPVKVVDGSYVDKVENKNLCGEVELGGYNDTTGLKEVNPNLYCNKNPISVEPETNYIFSINEVASNINVLFYDKNNNYIGKNPEIYPNFTTPANAKYVCLYRGTSAGNEKWQLEQGSTTTPYLTHAEQTVNIDTSPNPLYSENDCYKYLTSEQATALGLNTGAGWYCYNEYYNQNFTSGVSSVTINDMKSNGQFYSTVGGTVSETTITFDGTTTGTGNIIYELATPTYTKITDTDLIASLEALKDMQSYYDVTNISQTHSDEQVDMIINAKALKSLKAMQSETDTLLNAKVDKSSFVYNSNTETLSITMS